MLTALLLLPLAGALVAAALPSRLGSAAPKWVALAFTLATLALAVVLAVGFDTEGGMQYVETYSWIEPFGAHYALGVDGLGLVMVLLTAVLLPVVVVASWNDIDETSPGRQGAFFALILVLESLALAVFCAQDLFLFYAVFEATLIPAYFLIGSFGHGSQRTFAAVKFLLYMLFGGLVMLAAVVGLYAISADAGTPSYLLSDLAELEISTGAGRWLFLGFFLAFAVKAPIFPFHTWLPDTTGAATPGVSVLLICVLDKIGTYGMLRFCLELFPEASQWATPVVVVLALVSIVYGALLALGQDDLLKLVGLTSLSHFGFIVLGIFVMNSQGVSGAIFYMVNHGLATAVLFIAAGYLIKRTGTTRLSQMGGFEKGAPVLAGLFLIGGLGTLGLPGLSPFVSEFLVLLGAFRYEVWVGAVAVSGIVLAAAYVLRAYQKAVTGPALPGEPMTDVSVREVAAVAPVVVAMLVLGFVPQPALDVINPSSRDTLERVGVTHDEAPTVDPAQVDPALAKEH